LRALQQDHRYFDRVGSQNNYVSGNRLVLVATPAPILDARYKVLIVHFQLRYNTVGANFHLLRLHCFLDMENCRIQCSGWAQWNAGGPTVTGGTTVSRLRILRLRNRGYKNIDIEKFSIRP